MRRFRVPASGSASHAAQLLRITWQLGPAYCIAYAALRLVAALVPLGQLCVGKLIIDTIVNAQRGGDLDPLRLGGLVALELLLVALLETATRVFTWIDSLLSDRFNLHMTARVLAHTASLDLATIETTSFQDALERARRQTAARLSMLTLLFQSVQQAVTCGSLIAAVMVVGPSFVIFQAAGMLPLLVAENRWVRQRQALLRSLSATRRRLDYLLTLATGLEAAKEVRTYDLTKHLQARYGDAAHAYVEANQGLARRRLTALAWLSLLSTTIYYAGYAVLAWRAAVGGLTFGEFVFVAGAFQRCKTELVGISSSVNHAAEAMGDAGDLFAFLRLQRTPSRQARIPSVAFRDGAEGLEFRNVSLAYPGRPHPLLRNLSFHVRPGERIALVGENGSGKSTIVKLLCRLYDPDDGHIMLDGVDLRALDPVALRRLISVVFQDYVRFDMPVRDNVGFGRIDRLDDLAAIREAAVKAGALETITALPDGFTQLLGRRFEGGLELSGGEWQRIALARACMRDGRLVVFDEPTAALDARAEHVVFRHLLDLARNQMAVLVTHRLASARMADRILVLDGGRLVEEGDHASLMTSGGHYAELFQLQTALWHETRVS